MALPTALTGQAYDIVEKAMSSGARGQTVTSTDYSALSDAFMKKASLETQIGGMYMDNTMQRANLMAELDMSKASLYMQTAQLAQNESHFNRQMQAQKDADKMSPFEQITGVLAGAASGAAGGAAFGPKGAIIGGVIGGVTAMGAGNSRRAQSNTLGNIGMISNAAVAFKGISDQKKGQDASQAWAKGFESLAAAMRKAEPGTPEYEQASAALNSHIDGYTKVGLQNGMNLQQIAATQGAFRKQALNGYDPSDPKQAAANRIQQIQNQASAGTGAYEGFNDPKHKNFRMARKQFQADISNAYTMGFGKDLSAGQMQGIMGATGAENTQEFYKGAGRNLSQMAPASNSGSQNRADMTQSNPQLQQSPAQGRSTVAANAPSISQDGTSVPNYVMQRPAPSAASQAWGVEMDNTDAMVQDLSTRSVEMSKDPSIAQKALHQEPAEGFDSRKETPLDYHKRMVAAGGPEAAKQKAADDAERQAEIASQPPKALAPNGVSEPNITSTTPEEADKERVFKTTTQPKEMLDTFNLRGRFDNEQQRDKVVSAANATVEINKLDQYLNQPEVKERMAKMSPEGRRAYAIYLQGMGDDAMKGKSLSGAASLLGVSGQGSYSTFERSLRIANEERGNREIDGYKFSREELKTMAEINSRLIPTARQLAKAYNTGTLTDADVNWTFNQIANTFEPDVDVATAGMANIKDLLWDKFYMDLETMPSIMDKSSVKLKENAARTQMRINEAAAKQQMKQNDEFMIFD